MNTRNWKALVLIALAAGALVAARPAQAAVRIDIGFFFDSLAPYGSWYDNPQYGQVWAPAAVSTSWRPYTDGHWAYANEYGWTWASDDPWGWATDHYGRWVYDDYEGWIWVPGYEWAPAWVDWVSYDDYVGWAPLPPAATWSVNVGFAPRYNIGYDRYTFVQPRYLGSTSWRSYAAPRERAVRWARDARRITRYQSYGDRIVNRSLSYVPRTTVQVVDVASPRSLRRGIERGQMTVFRPQVARDSRLRPQRVAAAARRDRVAVSPRRTVEPRVVRAPQRTAITRRLERQRPIVTPRIERQRQPAVSPRDVRERRQVLRQRAPQRVTRQATANPRRSGQQFERGHQRRQTQPAREGGGQNHRRHHNGG